MLSSYRLPNMKITRYREVNGHWEEYKEALGHYIRKRVKDEDTSHDLSHEVLLKVYNSCCSGREISNVRSWLFQIAHNVVYDYFQKQKKLVTDEFVEPEPDEEEIYRELSELISPLLGLLPEKYAVPLRLADIEGMKQTEISEQMHLSLPATKSRVQRARELLKNEILTCCYLETDTSGKLIDFDIKEACLPLQDYRRKKNK